MPHCYIFDTKAKDSNYFQLKASWCKDLPKVRGGYGTNEIVESDSFASFRRSGCTDVELLEYLIEKVYLPLYPNVAPITMRDEEGIFFIWVSSL